VATPSTGPVYLSEGTLSSKFNFMLHAVSWSTYWQVLGWITMVYYLVYAWSFWKRRHTPLAHSAPPPSVQAPQKEVWMEDILLELEKTVRHAERLHYHPDEVILLLQKKIKTIKSDLT
jgi:hypothetical protein